MNTNLSTHRNNTNNQNNRNNNNNNNQNNRNNNNNNNQNDRNTLILPNLSPAPIAQDKPIAKDKPIAQNEINSILKKPSGVLASRSNLSKKKVKFSIPQSESNMLQPKHDSINDNINLSQLQHQYNDPPMPPLQSSYFAFCYFILICFDYECIMIHIHNDTYSECGFGRKN